MENIKELSKELTEEMENDLGEWDSIPETEADKIFKEKILDLVKGKIRDIVTRRNVTQSPKNDYTRIFPPFSITWTPKAI